MRMYELMVIVRPDLDVSEKKAEDIVKKLIEKAGGKLSLVSVLGKKALSYPIQKMTEGTYLVATVESESLKSSDLEKEARMGNEIIRFLLTAKT